jgi:YVTN family beta-propeller protein
VKIHSIAVLALALFPACGGTGASGAPHVRQLHSGSLAASPDGTKLYVAHADADRVTVVDASKRTIDHEILLAAADPAVDPTTHRYDPAVGPRALAIDSKGAALYVTGQRSGAVYAIDTQRAAIRAQSVVCSEPVGVLLSPDDTKVFVACAQDDEVVELDAATLGVVARVTTPRKPWALAWGSDGKTLYATHLLGPGVSVIATAPLALQTTWALPDGPPAPSPGKPDDGDDPTEPHGQTRGIYDAVVRPGSSEVWVAHIMLGTDTPQPALVFNNTVFPALSIFDETGASLARLSVQANPGDGQAFGDVVSGPHAITFSDDGRFAFVVDADSEDVLIVDAATRVETEIVRPLPGHLPEAAVFVNGELYVQERNTEDVAAFRVERSGEAGGAIAVTPDGRAFATLAADPMPANLRLGQKLFYSANSDDVPTTQDHWVACASCHLEGRSDAVTWKFAQGPRDTPTNAGGTLDTGFLFRTADRTRVQDYWKTIDVEQGGHFSQTEPAQKPLLDAVAAYVNYAIPTPIPPSADESHTLRGDMLASLRSQGEAVFESLGCVDCHSGPARTDSGSGNANLDLSAPVVFSAAPQSVLLHDVGTCVTTGPWPDVAHDDIDGDPRPACAFDTPALRGLWDSAPYMHDGSAATLEAAVSIMLGASGAPPASLPSADDVKALVEYLRGL